jgi:hypothetical protein
LSRRKCWSNVQLRHGLKMGLRMNQQNKTKVYAVPNNQSRFQHGLAIVHRIRN